MSVLFQKLSDIRRELEHEKGPFVLFGLFMPEDKAPDRWDLVVSAPWLPENDLDASRPLFRLLQDRLTFSELVQISGVTILDPSEPFVQDQRALAFRGRGLELPGGHVFEPGTHFYNGVVMVGNDWVEIPASIFSGVLFERTVLFYNDPDLASQAVGPKHQAPAL